MRHQSEASERGGRDVAWECGITGWHQSVAAECGGRDVEPGRESFQKNGIVLIIQTILSTVIVLFTAEFTPTSIFLLNPNRILNILVIPIVAIYYIMLPIVWIIEGMSKFLIINVLRQKFSDDQPVFGLTDLSNYIKRNTRKDIREAKVDLDTKIFNNALEFKTVKVRECLIPRTEITAVDIEDNIDELRKAFTDSGHSKILVFKENIDQVIGYCYALELFKKPGDVHYTKAACDILGKKVADSIVTALDKRKQK